MKILYVRVTLIKEDIYVVRVIIHHSFYKKECYHGKKIIYNSRYSYRWT